jgi:hypothetical protein
LCLAAIGSINSDFTPIWRSDQLIGSLSFPLLVAQLNQARPGSAQLARYCNFSWGLTSLTFQIMAGSFTVAAAAATVALRQRLMIDSLVSLCDRRQ